MKESYCQDLCMVYGELGGDPNFLNSIDEFDSFDYICQFP